MKRWGKCGWIVALVTIALVGWRGALAIYWFNKWRSVTGVDPSVAELYEMNFWIEVVFTLVVFIIGIFGILLARRYWGKTK